MALKAQRLLGEKSVCQAAPDEKNGTMRVKPTTFNNALNIKASVLCPTCECEKVATRMIAEVHERLRRRRSIHPGVSSFLPCRQLSKTRPDATAMETWCVESVSAIGNGETLTHNLNQLFILIFTVVRVRVMFQNSRVQHKRFPLLLGWVHTATALKLLSLRTPTSVKLQAWLSLVPAAETACPVEPACATTPRSLKGPSVSTTRPSVKDSEASSVTVRQFSNRCSWMHLCVMSPSLPTLPRKAANQLLLIRSSKLHTFTKASSSYGINFFPIWAFLHADCRDWGFTYDLINNA